VVAIPVTRNPYVGPRSIADAEHPDEKIWGRERETAELANLLIADRIVLVYSPSGAGKTSLLQNPAQPRLTGMLTQGAREASASVFSPDGRLLATAADNIKLWDVPQAGAPARQIYPRATLPLPVFPTRLAFSPDGALLAASNAGRQVVLMETTHGTMLGEPIEFGGGADVLGFEPDGQGLLLWGPHGLARLSLSPDKWIQDLCARANRNLSVAEWKMFLAANIDYRKTCPNLPAGEGAK
jgi:WD40 repeat protein